MLLRPAPPRPPAASAAPARSAYADTLKVVLVAGVIVGHVTMAWTDTGGWALEEPPVREPLLTVIKLLALVGVMFAMARSTCGAVPRQDR